MSDCCSSSSCTQEKAPKKYKCPVCNQANIEVSIDTIYHHIKSPWKKQIGGKNYYFCETPECNVAYYSNDNSSIKKSELRILIGVKEKNDEALICYCFGVNRIEAMNNQQAKLFVTQQTKEKVCACKTHNPSGRCCLKDFPKN